MRRIAGYSSIDHKRNDILELKVDPAENKLAHYEQKVVKFQ